MQPEDLKYSKTHEWVRVADDHVVVGITDHAQSELGDIVFVELPDKDARIYKGDPFGSIESVKTVSDLASPVTGVVLDVNSALIDAPERINEDPYQSGWMLSVRMDDPSELNDLLSSQQYEDFIMEH